MVLLETTKTRDMGSHLSTTQSITNNVALQSADYCDIQGSDQLNGDTIVIVGGTGSVTIGGYLNMTNSQCSSAATLATTIQSILTSIASQSSTTVGFAIPTLHDMSITNTIMNQISESVIQSCVISASNTENDDYIFIKDRTGNISIGSNTDVSNSTCNISSAVTAASNSTASSSSSQQSTSVGPIASMLLGGVLIVGGIAAVVVLMMFSGTIKVPSAPSAPSAPSVPPLSRQGIEGAIEADPELLALAA